MGKAESNQPFRVSGRGSLCSASSLQSVGLGFLVWVLGLGFFSAKTFSRLSRTPCALLRGHVCLVAVFSEYQRPQLEIEIFCTDFSPSHRTSCLCNPLLLKVNCCLEDFRGASCPCQPTVIPPPPFFLTFPWLLGLRITVFAFTLTSR